jgi:hypothetical protein
VRARKADFGVTCYGRSKAAGSEARELGSFGEKGLVRFPSPNAPTHTHKTQSVFCISPHLATPVPLRSHCPSHCCSPKAQGASYSTPSFELCVLFLPAPALGSCTGWRSSLLFPAPPRHGRECRVPTGPQKTIRPVRFLPPLYCTVLPVLNTLVTLFVLRGSQVPSFQFCGPFPGTNFWSLLPAASERARGKCERERKRKRERERKKESV